MGDFEGSCSSGCRTDWRPRSKKSSGLGGLPAPRGGEPGLILPAIYACYGEVFSYRISHVAESELGLAW